MIQTLVLANSVHGPHSQISIRILSLSLFHKFVELRACGRQRPPNVIFWLKLVSVFGSKIVILFKNSFTTGYSGKNEKELLLSADTDLRDLVWASTQT